MDIGSNKEPGAQMESTHNMRQINCVYIVHISCVRIMRYEYRYLDKLDIYILYLEYIYYIINIDNNTIIEFINI